MNLKALKYWRSGFASWHPDFHSVPQKTEIEVRYRFWERVLIGLCLSSLGILSWIVFHNRLLHDELYKQNINVAKLEPYNQKLLKQNQEFLEIKNQIDAIYQLISPTADWLRLLENICQQKQEDVLFSNFDLKWIVPPQDKKKKITPPPYFALTIKGSVQGATDQALVSLESYKESFYKIDLLKDRIQSFDVNRLTRQKELDWMDFEMILHLQPFVL